MKFKKGKRPFKPHLNQVKKPQSRKETRREQRKLKKEKHHEFLAQRRSNFSTDRPMGPYNPLKRNIQEGDEPTTSIPGPYNPNKKPPQPAVKQVPQLTLMERERKKEEKLKAKMKKQRVKQLIEANEKEEKTIKHLEKQLGLDKRRGKSLPKSFAVSGLDYILDVCDAEKIKDAVATEQNLHDEDFDQDLAMITGNKTRKSVKKQKTLKDNESSQVADQNLNSDSDNQEDSGSDQDLEESYFEQDQEDSESDDDQLGASDEEDDGDEDMDSEQEEFGESEATGSEEEGMDEDDDVGSQGGSVEDEIESKKKTNDDGTWEDIYGRKRDKDGNIIQTSGAYVPPHLRAASSKVDSKKKEELERLRKQLKGLLNRLAETNMHSISHEIEELYMKNSRNDMNETLFQLMWDALVTRALTPERMIMEHDMLVAILHANIGSEIGAFILQQSAKKLDGFLSTSNAVENKELDNLVLLLIHLYTFEICECGLVYDILSRLCDRFEEKEVEIILLILRSVGFNLRKDDPASLKNFIVRVQKLASEKSGDDPRVKFMLEVLLGIKNNNMRKIPQYDPELSQHLRKVLRPIIRKGNSITKLKISLEDLLKADERGRWWVVGSAWTGEKDLKKGENPNPERTKLTDQVLELAKKQRMNSAVRKNIFSILVTAEDYLDAFERLMKLGLKGQPEQEIIHVILHCVQHESEYNPYYALIAKQFCICDRRHKMSLQYAVWDRIRELKTQSETHITNLAKFLAFLFLEKALPISVLKVMEFGEMDKSSMRLLRQVLLSILLHKDQEEMLAIFTKISRSKELHMFKESLKLFLHHFIQKNLPEELAHLKENIQLVQQALS